ISKNGAKSGVGDRLQRDCHSRCCGDVYSLETRCPHERGRDGNEPLHHYCGTQRAASSSPETWRLIRTTGHTLQRPNGCCGGTFLPGLISCQRWTIVW